MMKKKKRLYELKSANLSELFLKLCVKDTRQMQKNVHRNATEVNASATAS